MLALIKEARRIRILNRNEYDLFYKAQRQEAAAKGHH